MELKIRRCLGCGAPLEGLTCSYCKSVHISDERPPEVYAQYVNGPDNSSSRRALHDFLSKKEIRKLAGLSEEQEDHLLEISIPAPRPELSKRFDRIMSRLDKISKNEKGGKK